MHNTKLARLHRILDARSITDLTPSELAERRALEAKRLTTDT